ncbi:MotA/TolQ/ExbB proton channel family protein, partial [Sutterella sp.]|uniref:MotA/TolQ/ExbB proton channel family protein n=1 Tax=Sutterella sp. TaxID=1981025 RepID=UPI0026E0E2E4
MKRQSLTRILVTAVVVLAALTPGAFIEGQALAAGTDRAAAAGEQVSAVARAVTAEAEADRANADAALSAQESRARELAARKAALEASVAALTGEVSELNDRYAELSALDRAEAASRSTLESAVRLAATAAAERAAVSPAGALGRLPVEQLETLRTSREFPSIAEVRGLVDYLFEEMKATGEVRAVAGEVLRADGSAVQTTVYVAGGLTAVAEVDGRPRWLLPVEGGLKLMTAPGEPPAALKRDLGKWLAGTSELLPADVSGGTAFRNFRGGETLLGHLNAGGVIVWVILAIGALALVLGVIHLARLLRVRAPEPALMTEALGLVSEGRLGEAAAKLGTAPERCLSARILARMLEGGAGSVTGLEKSLDEAEELMLTPLGRCISLVAVAAAVAPLLGLLGTVTGMISTFDVITLFGNGDPKLLSGGISVALITTEVGLVVAIALMGLHYLMSRRLEYVT